MSLSGQKVTQNGPKMTLHTAEWNFSENKMNHCFSIVNSSCCANIQTITMARSRDNCKCPNFGLENGPFYPKVDFS